MDSALRTPSISRKDVGERVYLYFAKMSPGGCREELAREAPSLSSSNWHVSSLLLVVPRCPYRLLPDATLGNNIYSA